MKDITIGTKAAAALTVGENELAVNVGSGSLEVFATPMMAMLMEKASCNCLAEFLEGDETTVGTELNIRHVSATPLSMEVTAAAEVTAVNGREITLSVTAFDRCGEIGSGIHKRFVVCGEKFMKKTKEKLN